MPVVFDVCIVGSGPGGGIAAYALTKAGLKVALVESGKRLRPGIDYNSHGHPTRSVSADYSDRNHFTPVGDRPAHGLLRALGGRSLCWAGHSLRFGPGDFKRWPIAYEQVAPFYSRAERIMGVYGEKDGLWNMPDGEFQKPVAFRCGEQMLKRGVHALKAQGREMEFVGIRKAMPTEKHARPTCHYCGHCMQGCEIDSKYTSANTPIPEALKTGNLTMFLETMMTRIAVKDGRVTHIETGDGKTIQCKSLMLSCSAVETARHLLINGLANGSSQVGRNLTSHFGTTVIGLFPQIRNRDASNDDGTDYYHGLLTGLNWNKPNPRFEGTYQVQCGSGVHPGRLAIRNVKGVGADLKKQLKELNTIHAGMNMQGMLLTSSKKFIDLDTDRKDKFGLPLPRVHLHYEDSDVAMARDMVETSEEIIRAAGGTVYAKPAEIGPDTLVIDSNHWVGTARMGTDPKTSVVNLAGQSHDIPNLFIGDASVFPAYPEKNPTLTNIALTWRTSEMLAGKFKRREL